MKSKKENKKLDRSKQKIVYLSLDEFFELIKTEIIKPKKKKDEKHNK